MADFSITFDTSFGDITNETMGLTLNSIDLPYGGTLAFNYDSSEDELRIGAGTDGVTGLNVGTNDFGIAIDSISTIPVFNNFSYVRSGVFGIWFSTNGTVTAAPTSVPAPGSMALFALGLIGVMVSQTRRHNNRT